jgi:hypothetical protein
MLTFLRRIFCRHRGEMMFLRNIYGDEINEVSVWRIYRSWWLCRRCGALVPRQALVKCRGTTPAEGMVGWWVK